MLSHVQEAQQTSEHMAAHGAGLPNGGAAALGTQGKALEAPAPDQVCHPQHTSCLVKPSHACCSRSTWHLLFYSLAEQASQGLSRTDGA